MPSCERTSQLSTLSLPEAFDGLEGLLEADLKAIVGMLATRANERLLLTNRQQERLVADLWNGMAEVLNDQLKPLSASYR